MNSLSAFYPTDWPPLHLLTVFGVLIAVGTLGGLLAKRVRWLPTITGFMAVGLLIGPSGLGLLSKDTLEQAQPLVAVALGLILFKLGAALHPWVVLRTRAYVVSSLIESSATFVAVGALMLWLGMNPMAAALAAAIAVSSSPAVLIHVAHELHARGPTVKTAKVLVALNNVLAFVLFSCALPFALRGAEADLWTALALPAYQLLGAVAVGTLVAALITGVGRLTNADDAHYRFSLVIGGVMLTLGLSFMLRVSHLFAALVLGIACRWLQGRARLAKLDLGASSDLFFIILFVFAGAKLNLVAVWQYAPMALAYVGLRTAVKLAAVYGAGRGFGLSPRRALSTGMLLVPMAGLAIGLVQATQQLLPSGASQLAAVVMAAVAVFETLGPPLAAFALRLSGDAAPRGARPAAGDGGEGDNGDSDSDNDDEPPVFSASAPAVPVPPPADPRRGR